MGLVLRALRRPWRVLRRARVALHTFVNSRRETVQLQLATNAEIRELHQTSLLAAIRLLEEQRQARESLANDVARLEQRLEALERQLAANPPAPPDA